MDLGIAGRRAAVAASSAGLGLGTAQALAAEGVHVALCGRDPERLAEAVASITDAGGRAEGIEADVSTAEGARGFIREATRLLGGIDILVPNGGGPPPGGFDDIGPDQYGPALERSLLSGVAMCTEALPAMRAQGWGRIVAITSISVRQPIDGLILSNTARAGFTGFLKTLATEVAADGVTVNSVQPGSHDTLRLRSMHGDLGDVAAVVPARTVGRPEDFGAVVAFLCSDHARFVTGAALPVDGGAAKGLQ